MADINFSKRDSASAKRPGKSGANPLFLRDEALREAIELLFYAYRDFTGEPDQILGERGLGRAHHRVIYFVGRYPGMTVSDLLNILKITKQSLSRVLSQLIEEDYIHQEHGKIDRRQRLLTLTDKGLAFEQLLTQTQSKRIAQAYRNAGPQAVEGFRMVMLSILADDEDRSRFSDLPD